MTLRCILFGHRRSRSRATFDEKHGRWISECRRCRVPLERESDGIWRIAPPVPAGKLVPIRAESAASAPSRGSAGESPFVSASAADSADSGRSGTSQHSKKPVDLSTS